MPSLHSANGDHLSDSTCRYLRPPHPIPIYASTTHGGYGRYMKLSYRITWEFDQKNVLKDPAVSESSLAVGAPIPDWGTCKKDAT